jgi:long-chain acyl-CoA synthetase
VHIVDRIKDLIIRGGENIACSSVEAALNQHPLVKEACAYGIPNERLGEEVGATLCVASTVPTKELKEFLTDKLARFEIPSYFIQQKQPLPRGASGKIVKRLVQANAIKNLNQV